MLGLLLFIGAGGVWWQQVASSPERVFYTMLDNSMKTRGIGRHVVQDSGSQKLDQRTQLTTGQHAVASSLTTLSQGIGTAVKTQTIGTPTDDYVRYVTIETDQIGEDGQPLDFGDVLGIWGVSDNDQLGSETRGELYGQNVLGVVPIGFVPPDTRRELIDLMREENIYSVDFSKARRELLNGRPHYTYDVEVQPENYIVMLKQFAKAVGLTQLETLDPKAFSEAEPFTFSMTVDIWSRQLAAVTYADSARKETYSSYGQKTPVKLPEQTISVEELQSRLQSIQ